MTIKKSPLNIMTSPSPGLSVFALFKEATADLPALIHEIKSALSGISKKLYIKRRIAAARAKVLANTYSDFRRQNDFFCPSTHVTYKNDGVCGLDKRTCGRKGVHDY